MFCSLTCSSLPPTNLLTLFSPQTNFPSPHMRQPHTTLLLLDTRPSKFKQYVGDLTSKDLMLSAKWVNLCWHYLNVSAVTNLFVNLIGVWFFRNYARINLAYRNAEDMNCHSVFLHVLTDSIRSAGLILASWLLSIGVENAEVLCLGLVSVAVFTLVLPLFRATGGILLQMAPPSIPTTAFSKCLRQISAREEILEVSQARFWELVPGHVVGSLSIQRSPSSWKAIIPLLIGFHDNVVGSMNFLNKLSRGRVKKGVDDRPILEFVHRLYHDFGVQDLTVQIDHA
ncbi:hypothetical protein TSUD_332710 [Trifolium subterraneum]|uniref:Cation efflux protein transmembrane domain-containing protein n=1 Tax=Trifolium subterraneum TaxID=3900 RepID=A0A2Z6MFK2_TRISU|nr:hypothetical protein TSUD_332710 [Trifolium subterraneum]